MVIASSSISMAGIASVATCARVLDLPHKSLLPPFHFDLSFASNSITNAKVVLKIKQKISSSHFYPLISCPRSRLHNCRVATESNTIEGEENEGDDEEGQEEDIEEEEGMEEEEEEQVEDRRRLYVGNLPYSMTESQLSEIFQEAGTVNSVEILYDRVTDRSRGFGFVTMGSTEEAKEAIRMFDGSQVGGRMAKVNFPEVPRGAEREVIEQRIRRGSRSFIESPYKVYAGNLSWSITSESLQEAFQEQPGFMSAKVIYEKETGRSRGFGFVSFTSAEEAEAALSSLNGVEVEGRPMRLSLAAQRERLMMQAPSQMQETNIDSFSNSMQSAMATE